MFPEKSSFSGEIATISHFTIDPETHREHQCVCSTSPPSQPNREHLPVSSSLRYLSIRLNPFLCPPFRKPDGRDVHERTCLMTCDMSGGASHGTPGASTREKKKVRRAKRRDRVCVSKGTRGGGELRQGERCGGGAIECCGRCTAV